MVKLKKTFSKRTKKNKKNEDWNWQKKKQCCNLMVKLKRLITYTKGSRKKIRNQNNEDQIEKIIPLIWIEWWNWKRQKNLQKDQGKKLGSKEWRPQ